MDTLIAPIRWESDYETAVARARREKKQILIYFHRPN